MWSTASRRIASRISSRPSSPRAFAFTPSSRCAPRSRTASSNSSHSMNLLTIASLTLRELARRRVLAAVAGLTAIAVGLTAWGMWKIAATETERGEPAMILASFAILVLVLAYMFSVVIALGAAFVAAPAIASDIESGVVLAILP